MGSVIGNFLSIAVGISLSPMPLILLLLSLFTPRPRVNAVAVTVGWVLGVFGLGALVVLLGIQPSTGSPTTLNGLLNVAFGLLLLFLAWQNWRGRPEPGKPADEPAWLRRVDTASPPLLLGMTALVTAINAKNTALIISGALDISVADVSTGQQLFLLLVFSLIASLPALIITGAYVLFGERVTPALKRMKEWLSLNSATIMTLLFLVLGAQTLGKGIEILTT